MIVFCDLRICEAVCGLERALAAEDNASSVVPIVDEIVLVAVFAVDVIALIAVLAVEESVLVAVFAVLEIVDDAVFAVDVIPLTA